MITHPARYLVGPTAAGKSDVAHALALKHGWSVLSADSMNIYRGMDTGTAKPTVAMQQEVAYIGLDLVNPSDRFSVADYITHVQPALQGKGPVIVCGGTGLYLKALSEGLDAGPEPDEAKRQRYEQLLKESGVEALQRELQRLSPAAYDALDDPENPRRLIRALERNSDSKPSHGSWGGADANVMVGIDLPRERLHERIARRAAGMFEGGLVDEVKRMVEAGVIFSETAAQAIGYQEALAVLAGEMTEAAAVEKTALRTRQLAKRQMTWFRNKMTVSWVHWDGDEDVARVAERVEEIWDQHECGTVRFKTA